MSERDARGPEELTQLLRLDLRELDVPRPKLALALHEGVGPGDIPVARRRRDADLEQPPVDLGLVQSKTGTETETLQHFEALVEYAQSHFGVEQADYRWSGQIIEPVDGLPFIGLNTRSAHVYVATGYSGNGMTWGTVAGQLTSDLVLGRANAYAELYKATRVKPLAAAKDFITENMDFPEVPGPRPHDQRGRRRR